MNKRVGCLLALVGFLAGCAQGASYETHNAAGYEYAQEDSGYRVQSAPSERMAMDEMDDAFELDAPSPAKLVGSDSRAGVVATTTDKTPPVSAETKAPPARHQRVILYSADLGLYVFDFAKTLTKAVDLTKAAGGYMQASTNNSVTLRVPAARFEALMGQLDELGDVNYRNITGTDVTEEFLDLTIRLKNAEVLRERLAALFAQANSVEDSLAIERELGRVTGEIEQMKGRLRYLQDRAAFSVVTLRLEPKTSEQVVVDRIPLPFGWLRQYGLNEVLQ
jgi:hypothetical protein